MNGAIVAILCLTASNFIFTSFSDLSHTVAMERSFFQAIAILIYYFVWSKK